MSYKDSSDVHNHLSTKHPLFQRRTIAVDAPEKAIEPLPNTEETIQSIPTLTGEEDTVERF
jgi:hypothetical protein